jgi:hypothetical protein
LGSQVTTYAARIVPDGEWWLVTVPAADVATRTLELAHAEGLATEAVASKLGVPVEAVRVEITSADPGYDIHAVIADGRRRFVFGQLSRRTVVLQCLGLLLVTALDYGRHPLWQVELALAIIVGLAVWGWRHSAPRVRPPG